MKDFNVTGLCIPEKHYMVDISSKITKIIKMVDKGDYFTINRPRQFGKTTTFNELVQKLNKKYIVIKTSFEGIGDDIFKTEEQFLGVLRNKYLAMASKEDITFKSVILGGWTIVRQATLEDYKGVKS